MSVWKIDDVSVSELRDRYSKAEFVCLKKFIPTSIASFWELLHRTCPPSRHVYVGKKSDINWIEQYFDISSQAFDGLAVDENFKSLICQISGLHSINDEWTQVWINRYIPGDYVPCHTDTSGDTQFLLCLQELPISGLGGNLYINKEEIKLRTGDAVLFKANKLAHGTTLIDSAQWSESGYSRVIGVIRFFSHK